MDRHPPPAPRLPLFATLGETVTRVPDACRGAWGSLGVLAAVSVGGVWTSSGEIDIGLACIGVLAGLAAVGALFRIAVTDGQPQAKALGLGPAGFQFGLPEARLLGAAALCLLFLAMIVALLGLTVLAVSGMAELDAEAIRARDWANAGSSWKLATVAVVAGGAVVVPFMLATRLALFAPATVATGRAVSLGAMVISRGSVWPLFLGLVATALPTVTTLAAIEVVDASGPVQHSLLILVFALVQTPLTGVFLGAAYRRLEGRVSGT